MSIVDQLLSVERPLTWVTHQVLCNPFAVLRRRIEALPPDTPERDGVLADVVALERSRNERIMRIECLPSLNKAIARETYQLGSEDHWLSWLVVQECVFGSRRIDVLAKSFDGRVVGYEVKASVGDLKSDIERPAKRGPVMERCTQFYYVLPSHLADQEYLIPHDCGLLCYHLGRCEFETVRVAPCLR